MDPQYIGWGLTQTDALYKLHLLSKTNAAQNFTFFKNMGEKLAVFFFTYGENVCLRRVIQSNPPLLNGKYIEDNLNSDSTKAPLVGLFRHVI